MRIEIFNGAQLEKVILLEEKLNTVYKWQRTKKFLGILIQKECFTFYGYSINPDIIESKSHRERECVIKGKEVYFKPCVNLRFTSGSEVYANFNSYQEAKLFLDSVRKLIKDQEIVLKT